MVFEAYLSTVKQHHCFVRILHLQFYLIEVSYQLSKVILFHILSVNWRRYKLVVVDSTELNSLSNR